MPNTVKTMETREALDQIIATSREASTLKLAQSAIQALERKQSYVLGLERVIEALLYAFACGERDGSVDWEQLNDVFAMAKEAIPEQYERELAQAYAFTD